MMIQKTLFLIGFSILDPKIGPSPERACLDLRGAAHLPRKRGAPSSAASVGRIGGIGRSDRSVGSVGLIKKVINTNEKL